MAACPRERRVLDGGASSMAACPRRRRVLDGGVPSMAACPRGRTIAVKERVQAMVSALCMTWMFKSDMIRGSSADPAREASAAVIRLGKRARR
jgi:hypothetical protein